MSIHQVSMPQDPLISPRTMSTIPPESMTTREAQRFTKAAERSQQLIRNRINYLALQEDKKFRSLQDVDRRSEVIAAGRRQAHMRKLREQHVIARRERCVQNHVQFVRQAVSQNHERQARVEADRSCRLLDNRELKLQQRSFSEEVLEYKTQCREVEKQEKQMRVASMQKEKVQAFLKQARDQAELIAKMHEKKKQTWREAVNEAQVAGAAVQDMEQEEMIWVDRLQSSQQTTQAALCNLKSQADAASPSPGVVETALDLHSKSGSCSPLKHTKMNHIPDRLPLRIACTSNSTTLSGCSQLSTHSSSTAAEERSI